MLCILKKPLAWLDGKLLKVLQNIAMEWKDKKLILALYMGQKALGRTNFDDTKPSERCSLEMLSVPYFFNIYVEVMVRETLENSWQQIKVGGQKY